MSLASSQFLKEVFDELEKQDALEKVGQLNIADELSLC